MKQSPPSAKRAVKIKKRFLLLNITAVLLLIISVQYIMQAGDDYDVIIMYTASDQKYTDVRAELENPDIVEIKGFSVNEKQELIVSLHSLKPGKTDAAFSAILADGRETTTYTTGISVSIIGTIIEENEFMVNFTGFRVVLYLLLGYLLLALGVMLFSFIECIKKAEYSYRMIAFGGIALFLTTLLSILGYMLMIFDIYSFSHLVALIAETGEWFMMIMIPPMAIAAAAVSVSNLRLMRREGFRPVNALGIAVSVVWLISLVGIMLVNDFRVSLYYDQEHHESLRYFITIVQHMVIYIIAYFESMLISTALCAFLASRHTPPQDRDYIIILGCAIHRDGTLTPLLRGRVDSALRFEKSQYDATGKHACFVPSGGQGSDEIISEGEAMERYLLIRGVSPERILCENQSVNTFQNMQFSKEIIDRHDADADQKNIAFATTNYHVFRGYILSKQNGFDAQGISAKTKWYFFPNAFLREFIGLLYDQKLRHLTVIALFLLAAIVFGLAF